MANKYVCIDEIRGCEGNCIAINDYRVAGPKPWGCGIVVKNWVADIDDVIRSLNDNDVVKVVRCKDCKHFSKAGGLLDYDYCSQIYDCDGTHSEAYPDDFCSRGERKDNG
jgi:hypothetical protein